jgi:tellurite resistance protein TehA-like permease
VRPSFDGERRKLKVKEDQRFLISAIMFFVIAVVLSVVTWGDVSLAAKIGFFAFGFASGISAGTWHMLRRSLK